MVHLETAVADTYVAALLLFIWDMMHNKTERVQSNIGLVRNNTALYTTTIDSEDTLDKYYRVFKAQVNMIKAHMAATPDIIILSITTTSTPMRRRRDTTRVRN